MSQMSPMDISSPNPYYGTAQRNDFIFHFLAHHVTLKCRTTIAFLTHGALFERGGEMPRCFSLVIGLVDVRSEHDHRPRQIQIPSLPLQA